MPVIFKKRPKARPITPEPPIVPAKAPTRPAKPPEARWVENHPVKGKPTSMVQMNVGILSIILHRHIAYAPDVWLLSCNFGIGSWSLESKELEKAKIEALRMVHAEISKINDALTEVLK